jgi:hypothetical protein
VEVALFEADKFPRSVLAFYNFVFSSLCTSSYHVGESLIPSVRHYFRYIGAEAILASHGFISKAGLAFTLSSSLL